VIYLRFRSHPWNLDIIRTAKLSLASNDSMLCQQAECIVQQLQERCRLYESALNSLKDPIQIIDKRSDQPIFANHSYIRRQEDELKPNKDHIWMEPEKELIDVSPGYHLFVEKLDAYEALMDVFNTMPQIVW
jgi:hypothetical protein